MYLHVILTITIFTDDISAYKDPHGKNITFSKGEHRSTSVKPSSAAVSSSTDITVISKDSNVEMWNSYGVFP